MNLANFLFEMVSNTTAGTFVSIVVIISCCIEFTPIKVSPLSWLGKRINKDMYERVDKIEDKLDQHVAEGYRNFILQTQDRLLRGSKFTSEEWNKILNTCIMYDTYIHENNMTNGFVIEAIHYIRKKYNEVLSTNDFVYLN